MLHATFVAFRIRSPDGPLRPPVTRFGVTLWRAPFRVTGGLSGPSGERMRNATKVACSIEEA